MFRRRREVLYRNDHPVDTPEQESKDESDSSRLVL